MSRMSVMLCSLAVLLLCGLASARELLVLEYPTPGHQVNGSINYDPNNPFPIDGQSDIPMSELAKTTPEFAPDQVHITLWTPTSMKISWATGYGNVTTSDNPGMPYDPESVPSVVRIGEAADALTTNVTRGDAGVLAKALVYQYEYSADAGPLNGSGTVYNSPIIHHVVVDNLKPGTTYFYSVGSDKYGFSDVMNFTVPKNQYPFTFGVVADVGQTSNSSMTMNRTLADNPDALLWIGDLSYADDWLPNGTYAYIKGIPPPAGGGYFKTYQPKWDTFQRLAQPLISHVPHISIGGNHELECQYMKNNITNVAYNARFPNPRDPKTLNTEPNHVDMYWQQSLLPAEGKFVADEVSSKIETNNTWFSLEVGPAHVVMLNNYVPYSNNSVMYKWLEKDLAAVDRTKTPWVIVGFHAPWYSTYVNHYKENSNMQLYFEPLFVKHNVDLVVNGHVHAYDRSPPVNSFVPDSCGPIHMSVGDGGNVEGLYKQFVDQAPVPEYCGNSTVWRPAVYQPTYSGIGYIDPNTPFCFASQAPWSDYRDPSFGHGLITFLNETAFRLQWNKNLDPADQWNDDIIVVKNSNGKCNEKVVMGSEMAAHADALPYPDVALESGTSTSAPASASGVEKSVPVLSAMMAIVILGLLL